MSNSGSSKKTLYLKLNEISEVHEKSVFLKDVAEMYCEDQVTLNRCKALKIKTIHQERDKRYVETVLDVIQKIQEMDSAIQVTNVGETDFIIDYQKQKPPRLAWHWAKTVFVCMVCFFGASFAIMTFNNDVSIKDVFGELYRLIIREESNGFTVLELSYSVGLALGIVVFFNHFAVWKLNTDPTPLEVEMRLYEDNISKTLIQNDGRKESGIDVT